MSLSIRDIIYIEYYIYRIRIINYSLGVFFEDCVGFRRRYSQQWIVETYGFKASLRNRLFAPKVAHNLFLSHPFWFWLRAIHSADLTR